MEITFVTGNPGKLSDIREILGIDIDHEELDLPEIQSMDRAEIAIEKAGEAYKRIGKPLFVVDTSLSLSALNGFPGPLIRWFWKSVGTRVCEVARCFRDKRASVFITIAYTNGKETGIFEGETRGSISEAPRGSNGFAWDTVFIPEGESRTFAEMEHSEKIEILSRNRAWVSFREFLEEGKIE